MFQQLLHSLRILSAFLRHSGDDLAVIVIPLQQVGQPLSQLPAAAAKFPANGDDSHDGALLSHARLQGLHLLGERIQVLFQQGNVLVNFFPCPGFQGTALGVI